MSQKLSMPFAAPPEPGEVIEVASGIFWARMPLPMALDHVNVYIFDEGDHWSVVDTGIDSHKTRRLWRTLLSGPLAGKPVSRVIATHHHLDHIGLAGWFMRAHGAELVTTRTAYLTARMLQLDVQDLPTPEMLQFWRSCGMDNAVYQTRETARPFNTADAVCEIPLGYTRICEGETIEIGGRLWDIHCGDGHAPEHATFWAQDGDLVIGGDQLLGGISPNIGLNATEPDADPVGDWLASCEKFIPLATREQLILTGHKMPYRGLPKRLKNLIENHHSALQRLLVTLEQPKPACACFYALFKRDINAGEYGLAMVEAMAHCRHLFVNGLVSKTVTEDGVFHWQTRG